MKPCSRGNQVCDFTGTKAKVLCVVAAAWCDDREVAQMGVTKFKYSQGETTKEFVEQMTKTTHSNICTFLSYTWLILSGWGNAGIFSHL